MLRKEGFGEPLSPQRSFFLHQARATPAPGGEKKGSWRAFALQTTRISATCVRRVEYVEPVFSQKNPPAWNTGGGILRYACEKGLVVGEPYRHNISGTVPTLLDIHH